MHDEILSTVANVASTERAEEAHNKGRTNQSLFTTFVACVFHQLYAAANPERLGREPA